MKVDLITVIVSYYLNTCGKILMGFRFKEPLFKKSGVFHINQNNIIPSILNLSVKIGLTPLSYRLSTGFLLDQGLSSKE